MYIDIGLNVHIHAYVHYITHACTHTCVRIHAHIHTCIRTHMRTYIHKYINTYVRSCIYTHVRVAAEDRVQSQISPCGIFGVESGIEMGILIRVLPFSQPVLLQHLSVRTILSPNIPVINTVVMSNSFHIPVFHHNFA